MSRTYPRSLRHALSVVEQLPPEAIGLVVERLIARLDANEPDLDLEPDDFDACEAEDQVRVGYFGPGDADDEEEDNEDRCVAGDDRVGSYESDGLPGDPDDAEPDTDAEPYDEGLI